MAAFPRIALLAALCLPGLTLGEPQSAATGETYRALSSDAQSSLDSTIAAALGETLQSAVEDFRVGTTGDGSLFYQTEIAALGAASDGPREWAQLHGESFCIAAGNPQMAAVAERFGAVARPYPSSTEALIGLKLGECRIVVEDASLLENIAELPEWRRFNRLLPRLVDADMQLWVAASTPELQEKVDALQQQWHANGRLQALVQQAIDDVAFQAYVLADTLDCH
ncbi:transporter substrate-binding domain-containing protein [Stutzerimonas degradans]|uniref:Amino acid ABC transporter substrate-binding protein n=1 Tax=Stutzerimonas degradans TaxID=2968968 RepID=A0A8E2QD14_9GAMM|nr:transporter substrate-binding domain-containing protein [Stutzerimonas degradans]MCF6754155.1 amino acid ABC transporter substrate-binding protein [Stutzerimonas stutzeri]EKM96963.1 amino acid ABC transporter periplasmic amino acid-binding protein [Stutzerimonas degradans]MCQ4275879.1 amino acid ABC transporter substrate-binding protein [Stutzerimonas degradans]PNF76563.1 amino acid ABC transporter substrate-binding protein [Stutzerimonas degradans]QPT22669.1 amino acid ABC transporter subs